jgi:hypothetical protein
MKKPSLNTFLSFPQNPNLSGRTAQSPRRQPKAAALATAEQNHVINGAHATPNLRPLCRLMQRLLLPQLAGGWRRFGFRRYLWLLKRHHQRRRQTGSGLRLTPQMAQLLEASPLDALPLENPLLRQTLQHRGPVWWFRAVALRGEASAQQLLRQLLLQQQLWLQLRCHKHRRRRQLLRRRGRSAPNPLSGLWKKNAQRILRPLRRSRRRHQLKAQENLGRNYREKELELLTYRLVAALEPKLQAHRRRADRAQPLAHSPAQRLLYWLRGGSLPYLRAGSGAMKYFYRQLTPSGRAQIHHRHRGQRHSRLKRRLRALQEARQWLRHRRDRADAAKRKREQEEGEAPDELTDTQDLDAPDLDAPDLRTEERRLEEADQQLEKKGEFSHLSGELARLARYLLWHNSEYGPLQQLRRKNLSRPAYRSERSRRVAAAAPADAEKARLELVQATLNLLR